MILLWAYFYSLATSSTNFQASFLPSKHVNGSGALLWQRKLSESVILILCDFTLHRERCVEDGGRVGSILPSDVSPECFDLLNTRAWLASGGGRVDLMCQAWGPEWLHPPSPRPPSSRRTGLQREDPAGEELSERRNCKEKEKKEESVENIWGPHKVVIIKLGFLF